MKLKLSHNKIRLALTALSIGVLLGAEALAADASAANSSAASGTPPVFARVGDVIISQREFDAAFASTSRNRFYHGKAPDEEIALLQREVADKLITKVLLLKEAKRLKLKPDTDLVKQKLEQVDQRNANSEQWQKIREGLLPVLTRQA
ncbi:MAG: SurA N-terminal domain-containing protein, partial [Gallionella sp.]